MNWCTQVQELLRRLHGIAMAVASCSACEGRLTRHDKAAARCVDWWTLVATRDKLPCALERAVANRKIREELPGARELVPGDKNSA